MPSRTPFASGPSSQGFSSRTQPLSSLASVGLRLWVTRLWWTAIDVSTIDAPDWLDSPALSRIGITSPEFLDRFSAYNAGRAPHEHVRPFNFALAAFVAPYGHPSGADP